MFIECFLRFRNPNKVKDFDFFAGTTKICKIVDVYDGDTVTISE